MPRYIIEREIPNAATLSSAELQAIAMTLARAKILEPRR